jgi:hypothetical protein
MYAISTTLLPSLRFERVRVGTEASLWLAMVALIAGIALASWEMAEQHAGYEHPGAQEWAELLKPSLTGIGSPTLALFAVTRRHQPNRRHARLWRSIDRATVL